MKQNSLNFFFQPKSIAVIGATTTKGSVGNTLMHNLIEGKFPGELFPINPKYQTLFDLPCYPTVTDLPKSPELAIIITPAKTVPALVQECGQKGVSAIIIISAGFKELGKEGLALEKQVLEKAAKYGIRIIGPNCLGVMSPRHNLNATFAASMATEGPIALISQSGAMCTAILDWSLKNHIGFSAFVSIGSMADISFADLLDYLASDTQTESIFIYMETIGDAEKFIRAARLLCFTKPIVVIKPGKSEEAAKAAASHTGSLSGSDDVFAAAMERAGVLRVDTIEELLDMATFLATQPLPKGNRLAILTNAGGPAVLATDAVASLGAKLAELSPKTLETLNQTLPAAWSHGNPVDLLGDAGADRYQKTLQIVAQDSKVDAILIILSPQDMTDPKQTAQFIVKARSTLSLPLLASWMGGESVEEGISCLQKGSVATFSYPDNASQTFAQLATHLHRLDELKKEKRLPKRIDAQAIAKVDQILRHAQGEKRSLLTEAESKAVLSAYRIPTVQTHIASTPQEAVRFAKELGFPVVLKLHSTTITHKTDVGGVLLNLKTEKAVLEGFEQIKKSVEEKASKTDFLGVTVQKMISNKGYEIILGSYVDPQFGPVILFGSGGELVEVYKDRALTLPPVNEAGAQELMSKTKIYKALSGVRGKAAVDFGKLVDVIILFSELIENHPLIAESDINPLKVSAEGTIALDARIALKETTP